MTAAKNTKTKIKKASKNAAKVKKCVLKKKIMAKKVITKKKISKKPVLKRKKIIKKTPQKTLKKKTVEKISKHRSKKHPDAIYEALLRQQRFLEEQREKLRKNQKLWQHHQEMLDVLEEAIKNLESVTTHEDMYQDFQKMKEHQKTLDTQIHDLHLNQQDMVSVIQELNLQTKELKSLFKTQEKMAPPEYMDFAPKEMPILTPETIPERYPQETQTKTEPLVESEKAITEALQNLNIEEAQKELLEVEKTEHKLHDQLDSLLKHAEELKKWEQHPLNEYASQFPVHDDVIKKRKDDERKIQNISYSILNLEKLENLLKKVITMKAGEKIW